MAKRSTGSRSYVVRNPRGIPKGTRIIKSADGKEYHEGDSVSEDQIAESALRPWLERGQIEEK